jgi:GPH family glycoside/pentoside/hexuronide:cation symporter
MTPAISEVVLKETFPQYFSSKLILVLQIKLKYMMSLKKVFDTGMSGICFSAYKTNQKPGDQISEDQIRQRLEVLKSHTDWIRVFLVLGQKIPEIAKEMGFKTIIGAWIGRDNDKNEAEVNTLIQLTNEGFVDTVVGNEVLYRKELNEEVIINYINKVKSSTKKCPSELC